MSKIGTYVDILELENEMLRKQVKDFKAQLQFYLDAEERKQNYLIAKTKGDNLVAQRNKFNNEIE